MDQKILKWRILSDSHEHRTLVAVYFRDGTCVSGRVSLFDQNNEDAVVETNSSGGGGEKLYGFNVSDVVRIGFDKAVFDLSHRSVQAVA